eukprot:5448533-Pleurochrysis_carterae.AAC.2
MAEIPTHKSAISSASSVAILCSSMTHSQTSFCPEIVKARPIAYTGLTPCRVSRPVPEIEMLTAANRKGQQHSFSLHINSHQSLSA